ncbi:MAG TPA: hypothetical protein VFU59_02515 [Candidatus Eisenbacteria bacterium]|nr:hypothetical protein [Candidatus Eisenbacteria bacterium]
MKIAALTVLPFLILASVAVAADPPAGGEAAKAEPTSPVIETPVTAPDAAAAKAAPAAPDPAAAKAMADLQRIRDRAKTVDPLEKEKNEKSLRESATEVDAATAKKEHVEVAGRLAAEYGGIPELYLGEKERLKTGWGDLSIAHAILQGAKTTVTIDQLYDLRQEGLGWGQIAHGLDLNVGELVKTAHAKGRSAVGAPEGAGKTERADAKGDAKAAAKANTAAKAKGAGAAKSAGEVKSGGEAKVAGEAKGAANAGTKK